MTTYPLFPLVGCRARILIACPGGRAFDMKLLTLVGHQNAMQLEYPIEIGPRQVGTRGINLSTHW